MARLLLLGFFFFVGLLLVVVRRLLLWQMIRRRQAAERIRQAAQSPDIEAAARSHFNPARRQTPTGTDAIRQADQGVSEEGQEASQRS